MPRVPIVESQTRTNPLPTPFDTSDPGASRAGAAVAQGLGEVAGLAQQEMVRLDEAEAKERDALFQREASDLLYNSEGAFYGLNGKDAVNAREQVREQLERVREKHLDGASGRVQRVLGPQLDARLTREFDAINRHASNQLKAYEKVARDARIEASVEDATTSWSDPERFNGNLEIIANEVDANLRDEGVPLDSKIAQEAHENVRSLAVFGAIDRALTTDTVAGIELMRVHGDKLEPDHREKINTKLNTAKGLTVANDVMAEAGGSFTNALKLIEQHPFAAENAKVASLARSELRRVQRINKAAQAEGEKQAQLGLLTGIATGQINASNLPVTKHYASNLAFITKIQSGGFIVDDKDTLARWEVLSDEERAGLSASELSAFITGAPNSRVQIAKDLRASVDAVEKGTVTKIGAMTRSSVLTQINRLARGVPSMNKNDDQAVSQRNQLARVVMEQLRQMDDPTPEDVDRVTDSALVEVVLDVDTFSDDTARRFELIQMDRADARKEIGDIPGQFIDKLNAELERVGLPVDSKNQGDLYLEYLLSGREAELETK